MSTPIDVKMGVSGIENFKQGMNIANQNVKTLTTALKLNEKQLQDTGNKEEYLATKSKLLKQQIAEQNNVIKHGQEALKAMEKQGVEPTSKAYQDMQRQVLNAQAALIDMNGALDTVGQSEEETAQKTDKLTSSLNGINKKVSFDAVLNGIGKITDGMEAAARKVESLARDVWDTMAMAASWADNELTLADMYGLSVEELQQYQFAAGKAETTVEAIIKSQQKLKNGLTYGTNDFNEAIKKLNVSLKEWGPNGFLGNPEWVNRNFEDVFWDIGEALLHYEDAIERDAMANKIFGRSWMELMPMFKEGREEFEKNMGLAPIVEETNINKLNELSEAIENLDAEYQKTKNTILSELAPAFTEVGKTVTNLLKQFNEYLDTPEGQEKLGELSEAVTDLFSGLSDVDFGTALDTAEGILDSIIGALDWINRNHTAVETAIKGIGGAFLTLKAAEVVGTLAQGASALKNLIGGGSGNKTTSDAGKTVTTEVTKEAARKAAQKIASDVIDGTAITTLIKSAFPAASVLVDALLSPFFLAVGAVTAGIPMLDLAANPEKYTRPEAMETYNELMALGKKNEPKKSLEELTTYEDRRRLKYGSMADDKEAMQAYIDQLYDELYKAINDYDPSSGLSTDKFTENILTPLVAEIMDAEGMTGDTADWIADMFRKKFLESFEDDWEGTTGGLLNILQEAIDEKAQGVTVETTPILPEDAASLLQEQLAGVALSVPVYPDLSSVDGSHANGLPFVPFDGYIAALHRGERVVPASQNKSYTNTSNVYFDHVSVNSGIDAEGLAAKIAERTKHTLAGFGG